MTKSIRFRTDCNYILRVDDMVALRRSSYLKLDKKIEIIYHLFQGKKISPLIDDLDNRAIVELQRFMWEKTVEFGIKSRGKNFHRKEVTRKMTPTHTYQSQQGCTEHPYYCKGTDCINFNPDCARKKIKEHIDVMAESIWEYVTQDA